MTVFLFNAGRAQRLLPIAIIILAAAAACSSDDTDADADADAAADSTVAMDSAGTTDTGGMADAAGDAPAGSGMFDMRYCEVLLVELQGDAATISVYNTVGLNACPSDLWQAMDTEQIKQEQEVFAVALNGPRYFTVDRGVGGDAVTGEVKDFGGISMHKVAELNLTLDELLAMQSGSEPYTDVIVDRDNTWIFNAGREVYELVNPGGETHIMQSYSHQVDDTLTSGDLPSLGLRLQLPQGWSFHARTLSSELSVTATGQAVVIQDELKNTYQKY
jgi:hypothetical protein